MGFLLPLPFEVFEMKIISQLKNREMRGGGGGGKGRGCSYFRPCALHLNTNLLCKRKTDSRELCRMSANYMKLHTNN